MHASLGGRKRYKHLPARLDVRRALPSECATSPGIAPASKPQRPSTGRFPDKEASSLLSMELLSYSNSYPYDPGGRNGET
jgi:hypothetical protein